MRIVRIFGWGIILGPAASLFGQPPAPIADRPEQEMVPAGISELSTTLSGQLAYLFKDDDGTEAVHLVGDAQIRLGENEGQNLEAREVGGRSAERRVGQERPRKCRYRGSPYQ